MLIAWLYYNKDSVLPRASILIFSFHASWMIFDAHLESYGVNLIEFEV